MKNFTLILWLVGLPFRLVCGLFYFVVMALCAPLQLEGHWNDLKDMINGELK